MLDRLQADCRGGKCIKRVFFYAEGVRECLPASASYPLWLRFAECYDVSLSLCPDAVFRRGLQAYIKKPFDLCGLAQLFLEMAPLNRLWVIFESALPGSLVFKEGLDFLLSAASQDWVVKVIFMKPIYHLLGNEEALLAEYDIHDIEIWEEAQLTNADIVVMRF